LNPTVSGSSEGDKQSGNWWIEIVSVITVGYLVFSLISPMFLKEGQQPPRKIEAPDLVLIALVLLFNSGLLNRLEDFGISKDGSVTAKFKELKEEVNEQKKQIDDLQAQQLELQAQQLEQLKRQQQSLVVTQEKLEQTQAFMYNFLLGEKDYEKIDQLDKHSEAKTSYNFDVSDRVGDELRRLRDLKLITTKSGYISDVVQASDNGKRSIDLTKYFDVTDLGKKFLEIREKLQSKNQQEMEDSDENLKL
jgi:small-conductance mechanosensitive channel